MATNVECPLHRAVKNNDVALVSTLLDNNVDINQRDIFGDTALHAAVSYQRLSIVKLLLAKQADVNAVGFFGYTPLLLAANVESSNSVLLWIFKKLINKGADVRHKDNSGRTALHLNSIIARDSTIVQILLLHGAFVDAQDSAGQTALHLAVQSQFSYLDYLATDLLEWGASMFIDDMFGVKPLHLAFDTVITRHTFGKHIHKLQCSGLNSDIFSQIDISMFPWCSWRRMCLEEFEEMKAFTLGHVSVSDLFSKRFDPAFLENSYVRYALKSFLQSFSLVREFPIYASFIKVMFIKCEQRLSLLNMAQSVDLSCVKTPLPKEIRRMILTYLDNEDLRNVIIAGQDHDVFAQPLDVYPWFLHFIYS